MKNKIVTITAAVGLLAIAGCTVPAPYVSDFNGDSVDITVPLGAPVSSAYEMAAKTCNRAGKSKAELASSKPSGNYGDTEYLFLCLD
ncbi:hypothetical protein G5B39_13890 (plasmid) [Rhodobacteraceae bacterium SC52]|nr:hypothetical protein G5B39_13890 [Rhodobacteraceae bacterium SC52]